MWLKILASFQLEHSICCTGASIRIGSLRGPGTDNNVGWVQTVVGPSIFWTSCLFSFHYLDAHNCIYLVILKNECNSTFYATGRLPPQHITSGQSNLTKGRIAAAHGRFNSIRLVAAVCTPPNNAPEPTRILSTDGISIGSAILRNWRQNVVRYGRACPFP